jgi:predicted ATPase
LAVIEPYEEEENSLPYELTMVRLGKTSAYRIEHEFLGTIYGGDEYREDQPSRKLLQRDAHHSAMELDSKWIEAPPALVPDAEALLSAAAGPFTSNRFVADFQRELASWRVYQYLQTHREATIRTPQVTRADTQISADGQNLVTVLHSLCMGNRDFEREVASAMRAAYGDDFDKLVFPPAADQRIQMRIRSRSMKREQSTADLSDGTLRSFFARHLGESLAACADRD